MVVAPDEASIFLLSNHIGYASVNFIKIIVIQNSVEGKVYHVLEDTSNFNTSYGLLK